MKRLFGLATVICAVGLISGCGSDDESTNGGNGGDGGSGGGPGNRAPTIDSLTADRSTVVAAGIVTITVVASDPDGDPLQYSWSASVGTLSATEGEGPVSWTAPADRGSAAITVTVDDGNGGSDEATADVAIKAWALADTSAVIGSTAPLKDVDFISADEGWITGGSETDNTPYIFHFTGGSWVDETPPDEAHMHGVEAVAADDVWVAGSYGAGYHWDGEDWSSFTMTGGCIHGLTFLSATDGWATPAHGQYDMRHYTGGSLGSWSSVPGDMAQGKGHDDVNMVSETDGWVVGQDGTLIRYDGSRWNEQTSPTTKDLIAVRMLSADDGWIVGADGVSFRYDGTTWNPVDTGVTADLFGLAVVDANNVWAVGSGGTILFFDGNGWMSVPSPSTETLEAIDMLDEGEGWIIGAGGTVIHFE